MTTKKQELIDEPKEYKNDEHSLVCFYSVILAKYCLMFNSKLITYKSWNGFVSKRNQLIEKYNLS